MRQAHVRDHSLSHGADEEKEHYSRLLFTAEEIWCRRRWLERWPLGGKPNALHPLVLDVTVLHEPTCRINESIGRGSGGVSELVTSSLIIEHHVGGRHARRFEGH